MWAGQEAGEGKGGDLRLSDLTWRAGGRADRSLASLCVPGDRAVWPAAQRPAETVSAALPVLQPPAPHPSALPLPHLSLLQQPAQQGRPAAGDELRAAGHLHPGKHRTNTKKGSHGATVNSCL